MGHIINNRHMHPQPHPQRQPFLDKFQGKKNIISKEGLLHLLENHLEAYSRPPQNHPAGRKGPLDKLKPISQQERHQQILHRNEPYS